MKNRKKTVLTGGLLVAVLGCVILGFFLTGHFVGGRSGNLARGKGVIATCDSVEQESLSADMAIDGDDTTLASRWSSENNWEDASHYIQLEFPEEISVSFVVLKWERRNVVSYALESSLDGQKWEIIQKFDTAPAERYQEIVLDEAVRVRFLRLSTYAVSKEESDYSNLYQNVSLYEFEVYADKPAAYLLETPAIESSKEGGRRLAMPQAPAGYQVVFIGADLEQVIGADGTVYETIQEKEVTVGYRVEDVKGREEPREVSFTIQVPAGIQAVEQEEGEEQEERRQNACPEGMIPAVAEWCGGEGVFRLGKTPRIIVDTDSFLTKSVTDAKADTQVLRDMADLLNRQCESCGIIQEDMMIYEGTLEDVRAGDVYLGCAEKSGGLGEEGYTCDITDKCVIKAENVTGIRWGCVTLMQLLLDGEDNTVPRGRIRDYPLYTVRGFGIDVARKPVSIETLYDMLEVMSWYKMNDFSIHLNDNTILATSGLTDSPEQAMTADGAFRLESDIRNEKGEALTSQEYAYTREEFDRFIKTARIYGVTVVPEIDTPAHSLSITKLYPEYALRTSNESVDQINLEKEEAVILVERLWREALAEETGAFRQARIVNIGMDEYYGEGEQYRQFLTRINDLVQETGKVVRLWGSLSHIDGTTWPSAENLQMNIWSTVWADPREMYEAGYSLINMQNNHLYIIPGGGYDRLDSRELYENWEPNKFYDYNQMEMIPAYSPKMLGAAYMIWNDMSGSLDIGISEYDLYERFREPLAVLSMKLWGTWKRGNAVGETWDLGTLEEPEIPFGVGACELYADTDAVEPDYEIQMKVYLDFGALAEPGQDGTYQEQILAQGDGAYAKWAFYAVEPQTGRVGFTREGRTYTFDYTLPRGEWVNLTLVGTSGKVTLYVDNQETDTVGSDEPFKEHATFVFPLQRVGRQTTHFEGEMELDLRRPAAETFRNGD